MHELFYRSDIEETQKLYLEVFHSFVRINLGLMRFPLLTSSARTVGAGWVCALRSPVQMCAHVSIACFAALINLITA